MVQLSQLCMTTGKTIAIWTFVGKVRALLFDTVWVYHSFPSMAQASFNFMTAVTVHSDFGAQENSLPLLPLFLFLFVMKCWNQMPSS